MAGHPVPVDFDDLYVQALVHAGGVYDTSLELLRDVGAPDRRCVALVPILPVPSPTRGWWGSVTYRRAGGDNGDATAGLVGSWADGHPDVAHPDVAGLLLPPLARMEVIRRMRNDDAAAEEVGPLDVALGPPAGVRARARAINPTDRARAAGPFSFAARLAPYGVDGATSASLLGTLNAACAELGVTVPTSGPAILVSRVPFPFEPDARVCAVAIPFAVALCAPFIGLLTPSLRGATLASFTLGVAAALAALIAWGAWRVARSHAAHGARAVATAQAVPHLRAQLQRFAVPLAAAGLVADVVTVNGGEWPERLHDPVEPWLLLHVREAAGAPPAGPPLPAAGAAAAMRRARAPCGVGRLRPWVLALPLVYLCVAGTIVGLQRADDASDVVGALVALPTYGAREAGREVFLITTIPGPRRRD